MTCVVNYNKWTSRRACISPTQLCRTYEPSDYSRTLGISEELSISLSDLRTCRLQNLRNDYSLGHTELEFSYLCCLPECRLLLTPSPASIVLNLLDSASSRGLSQSIRVVCASLDDTFRPPTPASSLVSACHSSHNVLPDPV